ncbi:unnamed protein product [Sphenostylis stenocarpa]|uniref:Glycosyltransferase N-terminal domain-containing protein n=1 Tax=Sphenostylis stenocarpa TaxID=92480 RepID=A0AA86V5S7_9FABA|nr:unnamed protein product [Sphenostylis stenocarpa]
MGIQHVLVLPLPAQGHVNPLMRFSKKLAQHGFKVTFVNTDFNHKRVVSATNEEVDLEGSAVRLISIPDGLGPEDDRNDLASLITAILRTMPSALEKVIKDNMNALDHDVDGGSEKTTVIVVDLSMAWALEVADKLGIKGAVFSPHSAAVFVLEENISKLIERGIINGDVESRWNIKLVHTSSTSHSACHCRISNFKREISIIPRNAGYAHRLHSMVPCRLLN